MEMSCLSSASSGEDVVSTPNLSALIHRLRTCITRRIWCQVCVCVELVSYRWWVVVGDGGEQSKSTKHTHTSNIQSWDTPKRRKNRNPQSSSRMDDVRDRKEDDAMSSEIHHLSVKVLTHLEERSSSHCLMLLQQQKLSSRSSSWKDLRNATR